MAFILPTSVDRYRLWWISHVYITIYYFLISHTTVFCTFIAAHTFNRQKMTTTLTTQVTIYKCTAEWFVFTKTFMGTIVVYWRNESECACDRQTDSPMDMTRVEKQVFLWSADHFIRGWSPANRTRMYGCQNAALDWFFLVGWWRWSRHSSISINQLRSSLRADQQTRYIDPMLG